MLVGLVECDQKLIHLACTKLIIRSHVTEMLLYLVVHIVSVKKKAKLQALRRRRALAITTNVPPIPTTPPRSNAPPIPNSTTKKKLFASYQRHLGASSSEDDEDSSSTDDETPIEQSDYSKVNLITSIQNIRSLVNAMKCPRCDLVGNYGFKVTKRLGLS